MRTRHLFCQITLLIGLLCLSQASNAIDVWATPIKAGGPLAGKKDCQFEVITAWEGRQLSWDGPCKDGKAHGQGVLRAYKKDAPPQLFYGVLDHGELRKGVIDNADGGYFVGEFASGVLKPTDDATVGALTVDTFHLASEIAKAYSVRLNKAGNAASAAFYLKQSQKLSAQMD
jgi:hypothetical protein